MPALRAGDQQCQRRDLFPLSSSAKVVPPRSSVFPLGNRERARAAWVCHRPRGVAPFFVDSCRVTIRFEKSQASPARGVRVAVGVSRGTALGRYAVRTPSSSSRGAGGAVRVALVQRS